MLMSMTVSVVLAQTSKITLEPAKMSAEEIAAMKELLKKYRPAELNLTQTDSMIFMELLNNGNQELEGGIAEDGAFVRTSRYGDSWKAYILRDDKGFCLLYEVVRDNGLSARACTAVVPRKIKAEL